METITRKIGMLLHLLNKTIKNQDEQKIKEAAKKWVDILEKYRPDVEISLETPPDEGRLWYLLETNEESVLSQLPQLEAVEAVEDHADKQNSTEPAPNIPEVTTTQPIVEEETHIVPPEIQAEPVIEQKQIEETPALLPNKAIVSTPPPEPPLLAVQMQHSVENIEMPNFFTESQAIAAAAFHDKLCLSLEKAFQSINKTSNLQFNAIMAKLAEIDVEHRKELHLAETRLNNKLYEMFRTTCIAANGAESLTALLTSFKTELKHTPEFKI